MTEAEMAQATTDRQAAFQAGPGSGLAAPTVPQTAPRPLSAGVGSERAQSPQIAGSASQALATADAMTIDRPSAGQVKVIDLAGAKHLKFGFTLSDCTVSILDVDVVLMFPDGGKLLLPAFVMQMITADPPKMQFGNLVVEPQSVIAAAGDVHLADPLPRLAISDNAKAVEKAHEALQPTPQVVQMPSAPAFSNTPSPAARLQPIYGVGIEGDALHETNGRFARKIDLQEQQSSSLKSEGAITSSTEKVPIELVTAQTQVTQATQALERAQAQLQAQASTSTNTKTGSASNGSAIPYNGWTDQANIVTEENVAALQNTASINAGQGQNFVFALAGGADAALFTINQATGALTFNVAPDFEMPGDAGANNVYNIIVAVSDGNVTDTQEIAVIVTNQNEAPVITSNGGGVSAAFARSENGTAVTNVTAIDPDAGAVVAYSIVGGADAGKFTINAATGVLTFVSTPDFEAPTDVGANNVYDVIVQANDGALSDTQAIAVTITNLNEAPVITSDGGGASAAISVSENGISVTTVAATDQDAGATQTYSIVGGADAGLFTINAATGVLTFISARDRETPTDAGGDNVYDVTVQVTDGLLTDAQAIAVTVTNANEAPVITSNGGGVNAAISLSENGTAVTTVAASDPDAGAIQTYSIIGGADAGKFTINAATGVLTFVSTPDFEAPTDVGANNVYDVIVQVSDGALTDTQAIAVTVTNQNEAPVITSNGGGATAAISVAENGTGVTTIVASDPDAGAIQTYSIVGGADAGKFTINAATGVLTFVSAPNREAPADAGGDNVYDVTVQVTDGLLTDTQAIAVTVTDVAELPVITSNGGGVNAAISLSENGTAVTTVAATHPDPVAILAYSISGGADAARFTINATTGVLTFVSAPNFEVPTDAGADNVYDVNVQVSDGVLTDTQTIAVTITNQNEAPVITSNGGGAYAALSVSENGTAITTVTATDQDASTTLTYSIIGGADAARFTINPATGALVFNSPANFESPTDADGDNVYRVRVQVSDGALTDFQDVDVTVTNQNEAPVITSNGGGVSAAVSVAENSTAVTTVAASDPDAGATQTYSITGGADAAKFTVNATTGVLTFITGPNFEAPTDAGGNNVYDVIVQVTDGTLTDTQAVAVTVTNVNEAPNILSLSNNSLNENSAFNTVIGTVFAADPEGSAVTYRLVDDAGGAFWIRETTGELMVWDSRFFDYENKTSHQVTVEARDASGNASTMTYTINVNNLADAANTRVFQAVTSGHDNSTGGTTNDIYIGSAGNDTIFGGDGNDFFGSGDGNDTYNGGNGYDEFNVNMHQGVDTIIGGAGTDVLYIEDSGYDSTLNLTASGSVVTGTNSSAQTVFTTTEVEEYEYYTNSSGGALNVSAGMAGAGITKIEFYGELGDDVLSAAASDVFMYVRGGNGNDTLTTGSGNDDIDGGNGNNTINSGAGNDVINTGSGTDLVIAGSGNDNVDTFDGNDTIYGGDGNDDLDGRAGDDLIYGENGNDVLWGDTGNDTIDGGSGDDTIDAGDGNDTIHSGLGNDLLIGGNGNDSLIGTAGAGNTTMRGGAGDDLLDDRLGSGRGVADYSDQTGAVTVSLLLQNVAQNTGSAGNDTLMGMNDLTGGSGNDTLTGDNVGIGNILSGGGGNDTIYGNGGTDTLNGDGGNDTLNGGAGNDTVNGGNGDDEIYVGIAEGNDTINGGSGYDIAYIVHAGVAATVNLTASGSIVTATNASAQTILTTTGVEDIEFQSSASGGTLNVGAGMVAAGIQWVNLVGGSGYDVVSAAGTDAKLDINGNGGGLNATGGSGDDYIVSGNGSENSDDIINGGGGNDFLDGQDGNNTIDGGSGNDTIYGGAGNDSILGGAGNDVISSEFGDDVIDGGSGDDTIYAGGGNDSITGGTGNDTLYGESGDDTFHVWNDQGNQTIDGNAGNDLVQIHDGAGDNTVNLTASGSVVTATTGLGQTIFTATDLYEIAYDTGASGGTLNVGAGLNAAGITWVTLTGDNGMDVVSAASADVNMWIESGGGNDTITTGLGNDHIEGGIGDDTINSGADDDTVYGGSGNDSIFDNGGSISIIDAGNNDDYIEVNALMLQNAASDVVGGSGYDTLTFTGAGTVTIAQLAGSVRQIERFVSDATNEIADFTNTTSVHVTTILGVSGPGNTLTIDIGVGDTFTVAAGEFYAQTGNDYTFFSDAGLTNEIARVALI
jgi:Ca2+-binding RTX toxin-like protein